MKLHYLLPLLALVSLGLLIPSGANAAGPNNSCKFNPKAIPAKVKQASNKYARTYKPSTGSRGRISSKAARRYLFFSWRSFGYSKKIAGRNARLNVRQAKTESSLRPNAKQAICDVNGCPGDKTVAGGLFQIIPANWKTWKVRGYSNRFAPLANSLAVVNIQINARRLATTGAIDGKGKRYVKILSGQGGWGVSGGRNACR